MPLGMEVVLGRGHIVLEEDPPPKGHSPQFSVNICCDQTTGLIKMPLGRDVDVSPGDIVLYGDPAPPPRGPQPQFSARVRCGPVSVVAKRLDGSRCHLVRR